jgi:hypothetical protein
MGETHSVEIVFDEAGWAAVENEAARLGIDAPQLVSRAVRAWLAESADNLALFGKRVADSAA